MTEAFCRASVKIALAQLLNSMGFSGAEESALDILTDIYIKQIEESSYGAHLYAEIAKRQETNANDVLGALDDIGISLQQLIEYHATVGGVEFPRALPKFPLESKIKLKHGLRTGVNPLPQHIPIYLPPFPEPHTYRSTAPPEDRQSVNSAAERRKERNKRKRQVEESLSRMLVQERERQEKEESGDVSKISEANYDSPLQLMNEPPAAPLSAFTSSGFLNPYLTPAKASTASAVLQAAPPFEEVVPSTITPEDRHVRYMDESEEVEEAERKERIDLEDESEKIKKQKKLEGLLEKGETNVQLRSDPPVT